MSLNNLSPSFALSPERLEIVREAAKRGLDFLVRHQVADTNSADHGRFPSLYDAETGKVVALTTNWTTGVAIKVMLTAYQVFGDEAYLEAARKAVSYLRSMQEFLPTNPRLVGAFHENTPQTPWFHPRDALTAAWGVLEWGVVNNDADARFRARAYADWFINHGMDAGYPRWTASFDGLDAAPRWYGSFHSGSAFFLARMYSTTGDGAYLVAARQILDLYNRLLLTPEGKIHVVADIGTSRPLADEETCYGPLGHMVPRGWIRMHEYNDDFGALANLEIWRLTGDVVYRDAALRFLRHMAAIQGKDGGFGPDGVAVPSAGGSVLLEMLAAQECGVEDDFNPAIDRALDYILSLQLKRPGTPTDGAFLGMNGNYVVDGTTCNIRAGGYALLSLLRLAGAKGPIYFPAGPATRSAK